MNKPRDGYQVPLQSQRIDPETGEFVIEFRFAPAPPVSGPRGAKRLLTVEEVAEELSVSRATVHNLLKRDLPRTTVGGSTRVLSADLDEYLAANRQHLRPRLHRSA
ncbi:MAG: helix-turn-helix domain-containing protein [Candidatus Dormibacteria bacterium]